MPQELILISASQRNPILWPYNIPLIKCTLTCMNDLTGAKVLKGERILFNAVKDIYFTSKMKVRKIKYLIKRSKKVD
jgi:hypothetical protein